MAAYKISVVRISNLSYYEVMSEFPPGSIFETLEGGVYLITAEFNVRGDMTDKRLVNLETGIDIISEEIHKGGGI